MWFRFLPGSLGIFTLLLITISGLPNSSFAEENTMTIVRGDDDDTINIELGNYIIDGGGGSDTLVLPLFPNEYQFIKNAESQYTASYLDYTIIMDNIELLQVGTYFQSQIPIVDMLTGEVQIKLARLADLYLAFFGRAPDVTGLEYWQKNLLQGVWDFAEISKRFSWEPESKALFPGNVSNEDFVKNIYQNCFGREPDAGGLVYWTGVLDQLDAQSPEGSQEYLNNRGSFVGRLILGAYATSSGPEDRTLFTNKHEVALSYVNTLSLHPEVVFDSAINSLLALVTMDNSTRYNAENVIDYAFENRVTITSVMSDQNLLDGLWTHDPSLDVDDDGDGWTEIQGDCNDGLTTVFPDAPEICGDGIDQDCNAADPYCPENIDDDGDGWTEDHGDCNDSLPNVYPGADEICNDGIDQDCSGADLLCPILPDPGDPLNYVPFAQGRTWVYQGSETESGGWAYNYENVLTIDGEKIIDGLKTTVFHELNPENTNGPEEFYLYKDAQGISYYGSSPADTLTSQLAPYKEISFPIKIGERFVQIDKSGLDFGEDLDGDYINERVDVNSQVTVVGLSSQTVPAGTFDNSAEVKTDVTMNVRLSESYSLMTATAVNKSWYAPGTGLIKSTSSVTIDGHTDTTTEELSGYFTVLAGDISPGNSDAAYPGKPAVGYDGTNYLVVSRRVISQTNSVFIGIIVNANGDVLRNFDITHGDTDWTLSSNRLDVTFDGQNYLIVFGRNGQIVGIRVTPDGQVLDDPSGFVISSSGSNFFPVVDFDGTNFMVAWGKYLSDYNIYGALVSPGGQVQDEFPVFAAVGEQITPTIAFDGQNYLVAWKDTRWNGVAEVVDIYATRVSQAGISLDPDGIPICTTPGYQGEPNLVFDGSNYFIVWEDGRNFDTESGYIPEFDIYGARIAPDGSIFDPGGFPINTVSYFPHEGKGRPTVAFNGTDYFVSWQTGSYSIYPSTGIYANWVTTSGVVQETLVGEDGLLMSGSPRPHARYVNPVAGSGEGSVFLVWVNLIELGGESKDLFGKVVMH